MGDRGTFQLDFGAAPGKSDTSVIVTGLAGIVAGVLADTTTIRADTTTHTSDELGSMVEAYVYPRGNTDHSADEHILEPIQVYAGNIVTGSSFTAYGIYRGIPDAVSGKAAVYGVFTFNWVYV